MSSKKSSKKLPANLEEKKSKIILTNPAPTNVKTLEDPNVFRALDVDNSFDLQTFQENLQLDVKRNTFGKKDKADKLTIDIIGVDAPIANAIRRVCIAEVPTMAIEYVWIENNTSIIQDEVLSHRLGLIPLWVNPQVFENNFEFPKPEDQGPMDNTTLVFKLDVTCSRKPDAKDDAPPDQKYIGSKVYSSDLVWVPQGMQEEWFGSDPPRPVHNDILIMKLRPNQQISLVVHCKKGIGRTHAKWSPVSTASYRLMPDITFQRPIKGKNAEELKKLCPMGVFDIEDGVAIVSKPRKCTMCRECIRNPKFTESIKLGRVRDHYIFSVESTGVLPPANIFSKSLQVLMDKCTVLEQELVTNWTDNTV